MTVTTLLPEELSTLVHRVIPGGVACARELETVVDEVTRRPDLWMPLVQFPDGRWYERLYLDADVEVWLISWQPDTGTTLHDHGGSNGAFRVLTGTLCEDRPEAGNLVRRALPVGNPTVSFGADYVHDVVNRGDGPAISVHAYSPPLASMTYYSMAAGEPFPVRTELVPADEPEAVTPAGLATNAEVVWS